MQKEARACSPLHACAPYTVLLIRPHHSVNLMWTTGCCRALLGAHAALQGAALLALARLMCTSAQFCDDNLRLLVTLLHTRCAGRPALLRVRVCVSVRGEAGRSGATCHSRWAKWGVAVPVLEHPDVGLRVLGFPGEHLYQPLRAVWS